MEKSFVTALDAISQIILDEDFSFSRCFPQEAGNNNRLVGRLKTDRPCRRTARPTNGTWNWITHLRSRAVLLEALSAISQPGSCSHILHPQTSTGRSSRMVWLPYTHTHFDMGINCFAKNGRLS